MSREFPVRWLCAAIALGLFANNWVAADGPLKLEPIVASVEQDRIAAIEHAMPSTVMVFVPGGAGGGSGVLISPDGYALTNFHVSSPAGSFMRCGLSDGNIYDAVIVGVDPVGDLALIKLLGRDDFPYAELADSRLAAAGDWCMVIGNPFLLASNLKPTVTWGILSGVGRYQYPSGTLLEYADCLQTDASINPGNSGGPIYDAQGRLLGVVGRASFEKRGRVNVGVGYAISINQAKNFLGYLHSGRIVDHATLGATVATAPEGGVRVSNILETSDAFRRGLTYSAEILEIDGRIVHTANDVQNIIATLPSGWRVKLVYRNEGETVETLVRLMSVHRQDELLEKMAGAMPPPPPREMKDPQDEDDEDRDKEESEGGDSVPQQDASKEVPNSVKALHEARRGFSNYHFNELAQSNFIDSLRQQFPSQDSPGPVTWTIKGKTADGQDVAIRVSDERLSMVAGAITVEPETNADLYDNIDDETIAGLLPALDAWRRMLAQGPKQFGETSYLGTMPLGGERPLRDCIIANDGELEVRFLSHPQSHLVEAIEVFADRDRDPAELWLIRRPNATDAGPSAIDLRYGTESLLRIDIDSWQTSADEQPTEEQHSKQADLEPENAE
ncbi:putative serine protease HhoB precursor [Planctomycetes bacterium CA13]|uniref:Putative serine protease HhoB n=1 Tax=Novipirellula herctigrandis TaxID=2527986 RepID=A0A5C5YW58_9BACT|nr:putative serine protease HhoB precursor [Planctomycetes bacterium CA13]